MRISDLVACIHAQNYFHSDWTKFCTHIQLWILNANYPNIPKWAESKWPSLFVTQNLRTSYQMTIAHTARPTELVNSVKLQSGGFQCFKKQNKYLSSFCVSYIFQIKTNYFFLFKVIKSSFFICIQVLTRENNFFWVGHLIIYTFSQT